MEELISALELFVAGSTAKDAFETAGEASTDESGMAGIPETEELGRLLFSNPDLLLTPDFPESFKAVEFKVEFRVEFKVEFRVQLVLAQKAGEYAEPVELAGGDGQEGSCEAQPKTMNPKSKDKIANAKKFRAIGNTQTLAREKAYCALIWTFSETDTIASSGNENFCPN